MKFIKPKYEILEYIPGAEGIDLMVERAARTCYKSEDKITVGSAAKMCNGLIKSGHFAMLEHAPIYLKWSAVTEDYDHDRYNKYLKSKYSHVAIVDAVCYVSTNYRVIIENGWEDDLKYMCECTEQHERRVTVRFTMDRVGSQSVCRHRPMGFAQESTRFCLYLKDKFGGEIKVSIPHWLDEADIEDAMCSETSYGSDSWSDYDYYIDKIHENYMKSRRGDDDELDLIDSIYYWLAANEFCEYCYLKLAAKGMRAEDARGILPFDLNTEIIVSGFVSDWKHFFDLRADSHAHPDIQKLAYALLETFKERDYVKE